MEPLKNEPATNTAERKPIPAGQKLEAVKPHPEPIVKKAETPITQAIIEQRLYFSGIGAAIVIAVVALIVAISAKNGRLTDQNALVDAFANALAKNSAAYQLQNSNAGVAQQPNSVNGTNGSNSANSANGTNSANSVNGANSANSGNGGQNTGSVNSQGMSNGGTNNNSGTNNTDTGVNAGNGGSNSNNTNTGTNMNSNGGNNGR